MKHLKLALLMSLFFTLTVHANPARVAASDAIKLVQTGKAIVVDVREPSETITGKVTGATLFPASKIGTSEWDSFVKSLPKDKEIYTYCAKGGRADQVAQALQARGLKANGSGGIGDWIKAGAKTN